jgi:hypothetical protein
MELDNKIVNIIEVGGRNYSVVAYWDPATPDDIEFWNIFNLGNIRINANPQTDHEPTEEDIKRILETAKDRKRI